MNYMKLDRNATLTVSDRNRVLAHQCERDRSVVTIRQRYVLQEKEGHQHISAAMIYEYVQMWL